MNWNRSLSPVRMFQPKVTALDSDYFKPRLLK